ncbi:MAG: hypothetical protein IPH12_22195 [Saprospirales bacterium]|jgi:hypothetical protein|nr:hypothetical protein [Saprospirales bacterium]MBK8920463.1 hypothetical protein [Saprospirales bacterium]
MTQVEIEKLTNLINQSIEAKPKIDAEDFMLNHWRPFIYSLSPQDRRMAWQVYLRAQANHIHAIAKYLQTLSPESLRAIQPALDRFVSVSTILRNWGEEPVSA